MSVYYVHAPASGRVKIGFAADPYQRFSKIQSDAPEALVLLAVEDGELDLEATRHAQFADLRVRGEWFKFEGGLAVHVNSLPSAARIRTRKIEMSGPLGAWIAKNGLTLGEFAEMVGTSQGTISRVCAGKQFPRRELMLAIVEATDWEIDANALLEIPSKPRAA